MCDLVQSSFCIQMINQEVKQQLLQLENRDVVKNWFKRIHGRELNRTRAREINAAAKQAAEFFAMQRMQATQFVPYILIMPFTH